MKIDYDKKQNIITIQTDKVKVTLSYNNFYRVCYCKQDTVSDIFSKRQWRCVQDRKSKPPYNFVVVMTSKNDKIIIDQQKVPKGIL